MKHRPKKLCAALLLAVGAFAMSSAHAALITFNFDTYLPNLLLPSTTPHECADNAGGDKCGTTLSYSNGGVTLDVTAFRETPVATDPMYVWHDLKGFSKKGGLGSAPESLLGDGSADNGLISAGEGLKLTFGTAVTLESLLVYDNHVSLPVGDQIDVNNIDYTIVNDIAAIGLLGNMFSLDMRNVDPANTGAEWYLGAVTIRTPEFIPGVPEPTTFALIGLGLAGIGCKRRQLMKA